MESSWLDNISDKTLYSWSFLALVGILVMGIIFLPKEERISKTDQENTTAATDTSVTINKPETTALVASESIQSSNAETFDENKSVFEMYIELPSYEKAGVFWDNIAIDPEMTEDQLIELVKSLHTGSPGRPIRIFSDDDISMFNQYKEADINYPDEENYPYPEEWADENYVGIVNEMIDLETGRKKWQLINRGKIIEL